MLPWSGELAGRIEERTITSDVLRGNPLGDPYQRPVLITCHPVTTTTKAAGTRSST